MGAGNLVADRHTPPGIDATTCRSVAAGRRLGRMASHSLHAAQRLQDLALAFPEELEVGFRIEKVALRPRENREFPEFPHLAADPFVVFLMVSLE